MEQVRLSDGGPQLGRLSRSETSLVEMTHWVVVGEAVQLRKRRAFFGVGAKFREKREAVASPTGRSQRGGSSTRSVSGVMLRRRSPEERKMSGSAQVRGIGQEEEKPKG